MRAAAIFCSLAWVALNAVSLAPATCLRKPLPGKQIKTESSPHFVAGFDFKQGGLGSGGKDLSGDKTVNRGLKLMGRIGSRPPSCANRCRQCTPCDATQIPASTDRKTVAYVNYEPEGWKCKCGPHLFDP